jgi:capsid portal protein
MIEKVKDKGIDNILAFRGFDLCDLPYTVDDVFAEPTQKRLQETTYDYVPFLTFDNKVLDSLYSISQNSPTVSGIIAQKIAYSIGGGFVAMPMSKMQPLPNAREDSDIDTKELDALNEYMKCVNGQDDDMADVTEKILNNIWSFGNCFVEVLYTSADNFQIRVLSTYLCRPKKAAKDELYPKYIGVSEDWQENYVEGQDVIDYPIFPKFKRIEGAMRSIMHIKIDSPNFYYWGRPDWLAGKIWGELEYRIAKYNQAKFENGFTPSAIVTLKGLANATEARQLIDGMQSCFTGTGNNSKMFIQALRDPEMAADVEILNNQEEGEFQALADLCRNEIITAHRWTPALGGMSTAGQLGSNQQIRSEFDIVYNTVIRPMQKKVLRGVNAILQVCSNLKGGAWSNTALDLKKAMPVSFAGDIQVDRVLEINEQRQELGREPKDGYDIILQ